jgi:hypothetical protein
VIGLFAAYGVEVESTPAVPDDAWSTPVVPAAAIQVLDRMPVVLVDKEQVQVHVLPSAPEVFDRTTERIRNGEGFTDSSSEVNIWSGEYR